MSRLVLTDVDIHRILSYYQSRRHIFKGTLRTDPKVTPIQRQEAMLELDIYLQNDKDRPIKLGKDRKKGEDRMTLAKKIEKHTNQLLSGWKRKVIY